MADANPEGEEMEPSEEAIEIWNSLLELINLVLTDSTIQKGFCESIMVLIPKAEQGQFRNIALLDFVYKVVSYIINTRITTAITFHDSLHRSVKSRGTGTGVIEAKLLSQLRTSLDDPLFMVFLDLKKALYLLDRERTLTLLEKYGVGPNLRRIIRITWESDTMVPKQAGYYGRPFCAQRGVRAGDVMTPTIFNIVVDAVVRDWESRHQPIELEEHPLFYIDDGMITGMDAKRMQSSIDIIADCFEGFGLKMNASKTKFMVLKGNQRRAHVCSEARWCTYTGTGRTNRERMKEKVTCSLCGASSNRQTLRRHQNSKKCKKAQALYVAPTPVRLQAAQENAVTPIGDPASYVISIPRNGDEDIPCPVPGCAYNLSTTAKGGSKWLKMRLHFRSVHVEDSIIIEEEGQLPKCNLCKLFGKNVLTKKHQNTKECKKFTLKKRRHFHSQRKAAALNVNFKVSREEIERVGTFKYLGHKPVINIIFPKCMLPEKHSDTKHT